MGRTSGGSSGGPEYLRQCVLMSLRRLKVDRIDLWQLHRIDPAVPRDEQFGVIADMQKEGLIRHVGLSEVTRRGDPGGGEILPGRLRCRTSTTSVDRKSEAVLDYCTDKSIGFIPWAPLASGNLAQAGLDADQDRRASSARRRGRWRSPGC